MEGAVFLDKDGTLLVDVPYNVDPSRMRLMAGADEALGQLAALGLRTIVVSNQAGVARGYFGEEKLRGVEARLMELFAAAGGRLTGFYYCPHDPRGEVAYYARHCTCRKPAPGMLLRAARDHGVSLARSWMIGDLLDDIEAGTRAGCRTILVDNGYENQWKSGAFRNPERVVWNLPAAVRYLSQAAQGNHRVIE